MWRNSWSGYAVRLWPVWVFGLPSANTVLTDPRTMAFEWRVFWVAFTFLGAVWVAADRIAMRGEYIWFRGWWVPRRFHVSEIVSIGEGGAWGAPVTLYLTFNDRYRKDHRKTIRMDLSRYMWVDRRRRLMDDIAVWLKEQGSTVSVG